MPGEREHQGPQVPPLRIRALGLAGLGLWALAACGPKAPAPLVFAAGGTEAELQALRELAAVYSALPERPRVEFKALPHEAGLRGAALRQALEAPKAPADVIRVDGDWLADLHGRGLLQPLDGLMKAADLEASGALRQAGQVAGAQVALPWSQDGAGPGQRVRFLALRQGSPRAEQAAAFIAWMASREVQAELAQRLGWRPSREDAKPVPAAQGSVGGRGRR